MLDLGPEVRWVTDRPPEPSYEETLKKLLDYCRGEAIRVADRSYDEPETGARVESVRMFGL